MKIDLSFLEMFLDELVYSNVISYYNEFTIGSTPYSRDIRVDSKTVCELSKSRLLIVRRTGYNTKVYVVLNHNYFTITKIKSNEVSKIEHPYNSTEEMLFQASLVDSMMITLEDIDLAHKLFQKYVGE